MLEGPRKSSRKLLNSISYGTTKLRNEGSSHNLLEVDLHDSAREPPASAPDQFWVLCKVQHPCGTTRAERGEVEDRLFSRGLEAQSLKDYLQSAPQNTIRERPELGSTWERTQESTDQRDQVARVNACCLVSSPTAACLRLFYLKENKISARGSVVRKHQIISNSTEDFSKTKKTSPGQAEKGSFSCPAPGERNRQHSKQNAFRQSLVMNVRLFSKPCISQVPRICEGAPKGGPHRSNRVDCLAVLVVGLPRFEKELAVGNEGLRDLLCLVKGQLNQSFDGETAVLLQPLRKSFSEASPVGPRDRPNDAISNQQDCVSTGGPFKVGSSQRRGSDVAMAEENPEHPEQNPALTGKTKGGVKGAAKERRGKKPRRSKRDAGLNPGGPRRPNKRHEGRGKRKANTKVGREKATTENPSGPFAREAKRAVEVQKGAPAPGGSEEAARKMGLKVSSAALPRQEDGQAEPNPGGEGAPESKAAEVMQSWDREVPMERETRSSSQVDKPCRVVCNIQAGRRETIAWVQTVGYLKRAGTAEPRSKGDRSRTALRGSSLCDAAVG